MSVGSTGGTKLRRLGIVIAAITLGVVSSVGIGNAAGNSVTRRGKIADTVRVRGRFTLQPNQFVQLSFRFDPGTVTVQRGQDIKFRDVARVHEPHTITIVRRKQLPDTAGEAFGCKPCNRALQRHGRPPKKVVEDDKNKEVGLDAPGDSRFLPTKGSIRPTVTAPSGTTLWYLCAIHPWMQGRINVQ